MGPNSVQHAVRVQACGSGSARAAVHAASRALTSYSTSAVASRASGWAWTAMLRLLPGVWMLPLLGAGGRAASGGSAGGEGGATRLRAGTALLPCLDRPPACIQRCGVGEACCKPSGERGATGPCMPGVGSWLYVSQNLCLKATGRSEAKIPRLRAHPEYRIN